MVFTKKKKKTKEQLLEEQEDILEKRIEEIRKKRAVPKVPNVNVKDNPIFQRAVRQSQNEEPIEDSEVPDIEPAYIDPKEIVEEELVEEQIIEEPKVSKQKARIISSEILDNGLMKFTFISNIKMGDIGQEFDLWK